MAALWITASERKPCYVPRINTESALWSAADVKVLLTSPIFLCGAIKATVPQCFRTASNCGGVWKTSTPRAHQPSATCVYESQQRCQHRRGSIAHAAASHRPTEQCYLSSHRQRRPENILTADPTATLMIKVYLDCPQINNNRHKKIWFCPRVAEFSLGLKSASWVMQHDHLRLNAHSPNWISTSASSSPSCLDKHWWKISTPALIKEMGHFDPTLN